MTIFVGVTLLCAWKRLKWMTDASLIIQVNKWRKRSYINTTQNEETTWKACTALHHLKGNNAYRDRWRWCEMSMLVRIFTLERHACGFGWTRRLFQPITCLDVPPVQQCRKRPAAALCFVSEVVLKNKPSCLMSHVTYKLDYLIDWKRKVWGFSWLQW